MKIVYRLLIIITLLTSCSKSNEILEENTSIEVIKEDTLSELPDTTTSIKSLEGSWGARLCVRGGENLDEYVKPTTDGGKGYDYVAGAKEIINSYPTMGHVITNATNNANAQLWTLRTNENVDAVMGITGAIIDEEFVPSIENEQIIIDVITE